MLKESNTFALYGQAIHGNMMTKERATAPSSRLMKEQDDITESMRAVLIDWLLDVTRRMRITAESLHLSVNILDRYLSKKNDLVRGKLQLLGITSLIIATKYEEIYPPEMKNLVYLTDNACTVEEVVQMEREVL